tara:strand:- start:3498 stop:4895 length:1398 start_codon:yes stop_codon:yes gene_type:complete
MIRSLIFFICLFFIQNIFSQSVINKDIFGFATSNTFTYFDINSKEFKENCNEISPKLLRFPGGAVGNFYHLDAPAYGINIKEVDSLIGGKFPKRARGLISFSKKNNHNNNYIYEFVDLAKQHQSNVVLVANMLTGDKEDIIAMISLMRKNNLDVVGVELGSELSNKSYFDKGYTIKQYLSKAKDISEYIKSVFPKIKTAIVAAPIVSNKDHRHSVWNRSLAKQSFYDAIIVHSYAKVVKGKDKYGQMIFEENEGSQEISFLNYKDRVNEFFDRSYPLEISTYNSIFDNMPIWITEWNLQYSKKTGNTLLQSLFVANYFLEILSNKEFKNISLTTFHNLAGRDFGGSVFQKKNGKTYIQSTFNSIRMISKIFALKSPDILKEKVEKDLYKYTIRSKDSVSMIFYINWSKTAKFISENNNFTKQEEMFGSKLFNLNSDENGITYSNKIHIEDNELKAYSLTIFIEND